MSNSKLSDKYHAGRGRALKELSRRSPKAEVCNLMHCSCWSNVICYTNTMIESQGYIIYMGTLDNSLKKDPWPTTPAIHCLVSLYFAVMYSYVLVWLQQWLKL